MPRCNSKNAKSFKISVENFKSGNVKSLFYICSCKCNDLEKCLYLARNKVPPLEHWFLNDQRSLRVMIIAGRDTLESTKLKKRIKRKEKPSQLEINRNHIQLCEMKPKILKIIH